MLRIAVLISGGGTNLQAIIDACENGDIDGRVVGVISNKISAYGLERAKKHHIAHDYIGKKNTESKEERDQLLLKRLNDLKPDLIVLAGYLAILSPELIKAYEGKIINIHPSLIPNHCGKGFYGMKVHESVIESKDEYSGATVHYVDAGVDTGNIILQEKLKVAEDETPKSLQEKVLKIEHRIFDSEYSKFESRETIGGIMKRALISVSDKTGIVEFAKELIKMDIEILSTGGTAKRLRDSGLKVTDVSEITGFPECLDGRVKTLHPMVHGGILARRDDASHMDQLKELNIETIDYVIINLYPFKNTIEKENVQLEEAIENIDIGGPTMLRSAAKNYQDVTVIVQPEDYTSVLNELKENNEVSLETKYNLALKVFQHTSEYDTLIATYLRERLEGEAYPETLTLAYEKVQDLRYGENPHQSAAFYREVKKTTGTLADAKQLHGKELSFNNINDANGALALIKEYEEPTIVAVKHTNACGVGSGIDLYDAYQKAYACDPQSIFGGIIAANRIIDDITAKEINKIFIEIVIAPGFTDGALEILTKKKNIRLLELKDIMVKESVKDIKKVSGGILVQDANNALFDGELEVVTERIPTENELKAMKFAWKVCKHIKSNGIVLAKEDQTLSIGPGQVSRIWALQNAIRNSFMPLEGGVLASDAFFPFEDCVETAAKAGIKAIIQPGGSKNDGASIEMANKYGITMVFTKMRHFKH